MSTPSTNSIGVTYFSPSSTAEGRYVAQGVKWGGGLGTGVTLTYSFPTGSATHSDPYAGYSGGTEWDGWSSLSSGERAAVRAALKSWSDVANLGFVETNDNSTTVGDLRFTYTTVIGADTAAHAYYPDSDPSAGDVWFSFENFNAYGNASVPKGTDDFQTILHEIGHALGLKHSFESPDAIPFSKDNYFFTVMSYSASPWYDDGHASFYPTTPMFYDLVAIQAIYGRNTSHYAGNTTYTFNGTGTYFQTIDDAGGIDRIVYNGAPGCIINLTIGSFSSVGKAISFSGGHSSRSTVSIGPGTYIENAMGGSGNDTLLGTGLGNMLVGRGGADTIKGFGAVDICVGGAGNDLLTGGSGNDHFVFDAALSATSNVDRIWDFSHFADTIRLENSIFTALQATPGALVAGAFYAGPGAHDPGDRIIYVVSQGVLYYDRDGTGSAAPVKFATLGTHLPIDATDFFVV